MAKEKSHDRLHSSPDVMLPSLPSPDFTLRSPPQNSPHFDSTTAAPPPPRIADRRNSLPALPLPQTDVAMGQFFNWPPFVAVPIDANTGKPVDPNFGMKVKREFYNVGTDGKGRKVMIAHKSGSGAAEVAKKEGADKKGKNGGEEKKGDAGAGRAGEKKDANAPFTTEDDATLKRLKDEGKTWAQIVEVLGRNKGVLSARYKEIKDGGAGNNDTKKEDKKDNSNNKKENKKQDKKPEPAKPASAKAASVAGSNGEACFTMNEWMTLQEDDVFSFGELQCLSELMMRDERHRWMRLASAFYDKTGRRVHPDDIREKFGEVGSQK